MLVKKVQPETCQVPATNHSPNSKLPVIVYRDALINKTPEGAQEAVETSAWINGGHWKIQKDSLAGTSHYHSITHEAYTVLHGNATYLLGRSPLDNEIDENGNPVGVVFKASEGDVFVLPAGVSHFVTDTEDGYEILGFYSLSEHNSHEQPYDMHYGRRSVEDTEAMRKDIEKVSVPMVDPIYGERGPMQEIWRG
ncbi:hypothetical protein PENANT_c002G07044 [Penicillium antarcticum]|uniref:Cupin type-1 domain-containing protein n=1 Tax=Penicillium antarcticum TaxID=416450 RepID=A0A1V6QJW7_9EURO|nr:uncharacterized protein N7508_006504 [Penicillium antarcticum]KAJ5301641.1 hypothetical protein N7508_006504 [Penicillium antarcticum]OQD89503.1 hypothetical protein PENANT_c002G07044 [Penicillium antarcticum]